MTYAVIDIPRRKLQFARAGHEPLIIYNTSHPEPHLYTPDGIALGLVGDDLFKITTETKIDLAEGDVIVLYTDGVVEAMDEASSEYGQERFLEVIKTSLNGKAEGIIDAVLKDIKKFTRGIPQHDDITMIALKVCTCPENTLHPQEQ